jgi:hypothetical protein
MIISSNVMLPHIRFEILKFQNDFHFQCNVVASQISINVMLCFMSKKIQKDNHQFDLMLSFELKTIRKIYHQF